VSDKKRRIIRESTVAKFGMSKKTLSVTENRLLEIEKKIAKEVDRHRDLGALTRAGVDRKVLLRFLALVVDLDGDKSWAHLMRERQQKLKSMAGRMETLASDAEDRANDPLSRVQVWAFLAAHGAVLGMKCPRPWKDVEGVSLIIAGMRVLAKTWRDEATKFGRFLDFYGDNRTNLGVTMLLSRVCICLHRSSPDHWSKLANLLTDAFEAAGKSKPFSADSLQKVWRRRGNRHLRLWMKLSTESSPTKNLAVPAASINRSTPIFGLASED
jgi:hypothetical protein